jgi:ribosomal protein L39E
VNVAFTQSYETFQAHSIVKVLWFRNEPCPDFLSVKSAQSVDYFRRRRHERKLNTINENPQMTQMMQIFYL